MYWAVKQSTDKCSVVSLPKRSPAKKSKGIYGNVYPGGSSTQRGPTDANKSKTVSLLACSRGILHHEAPLTETKPGGKYLPALQKKHSCKAATPVVEAPPVPFSVPVPSVEAFSSNLWQLYCSDSLTSDEEVLPPTHQAVKKAQVIQPSIDDDFMDTDPEDGGRSSENEREGYSQEHGLLAHLCSTTRLTASGGQSSTAQYNEKGSKGRSKTHLKPNFAQGRTRSRSAFKPLVLPYGNFVTEPAEVPASINQYLMKFQQEGIKFLYQNYSNKKGAILADDMGLGKTVMVMGLLAAILKKKGTKEDKCVKVSQKPKNTLIVAPAGVLSTWDSHLEDWGHFRYMRLNTKNCEDLIPQLLTGDIEVATMSYCALESLGNRDSRRFCGIQWHVIVFDEFHKLKNYKSGRSQAAMRMNRDVAFGLTGTPIQNNLKELWWLMEICNPGGLPDKKFFVDYYERPILKGMSILATETNTTLRQERMMELKSIVNSVMLRRCKSGDRGVLSDKLGCKTEHVVFCELSELQRDIYKTIICLPEFETLSFSQEHPCHACKEKRKSKFCCYGAPWARNADGTVIKPRRIADNAILYWIKHDTNGASPCRKCPECMLFSCIDKLLKVANHPALLQWDETRKGDNDEKDKEYAVKKFAGVAFPKHVKDIMAGEESGCQAYGIRSQKFDELRRTDICGKMRTLLKLLEQFWTALPRQKVLIFSQWTSMLSIIEKIVMANGYPYLRLDGSISQYERTRMCKSFNEDSVESPSFVFLVSTKAGGVGLNLTGATKVIIVDVDWNPSNDAQAQDRAYRIGQDKNVDVYRLVSLGTIEELKYARQLYKEQLADLITRNSDEASINACRQFVGVQGESNGELFGVRNLLRFSMESFIMRIRSKHVVQVQGRKEKTEETSSTGTVEDILVVSQLQSALKQAIEERGAVAMAETPKAEHEYIFEDLLGINSEQCRSSSANPSSLVPEPVAKAPTLLLSQLQDMGFDESATKLEQAVYADPASAYLGISELVDMALGKFWEADF